MFRFLNKTSPNITKDCWLCLNPEPPYYVNAPRSVIILSKACRRASVYGDINPALLWRTYRSWNMHSPSELPLGVLPILVLMHSELPREYDESLNRYFVAPEGTWWACSNGIVPCAFPPSLLSPTDPGVCILTHILPQVYYYSGEGGREHLRLEPRSYKRAPVLVPLLVGLGLAGSTAVGTAALITGHQNYEELGQQVYQDLSTLEKSVGQLEDSLSSLAEVVLQNRRGLDLLFLKQGGLCLALGETCCFYTNHCGVIKESQSQLRKHLLDREERRRAEGNCLQLDTLSPYRGPGQAAAGANPCRLPWSVIRDGRPEQAAASANPCHLPGSVIRDRGPGQVATGANPCRLPWSMIRDGGPGPAAVGTNPRHLLWSMIRDGGPGQAATGANTCRLLWSVIHDHGPGQAATGTNPYLLPWSMIRDGGPGQPAAGTNPRCLPWSVTPIWDLVRQLPALTHTACPGP
ncbi:LOW QUALITY PROTEIN: hypothetical protein QTO34_014248 [Cnephaeus nilssonii]|uniref:Envelope glycoprotein n=1 Tax=Cnephaeus nilssonii TaxID=3371016 RepID=A0AA40LS37_CNENI|nr:LOW QUALITY PROTEIN: hypothetical protein QTO34_014248 [Eptesicus nilssonii]